MLVGVPAHLVAQGAAREPRARFAAGACDVEALQIHIADAEPIDGGGHMARDLAEFDEDEQSRFGGAIKAGSDADTEDCGVFHDLRGAACGDLLRPLDRGGGQIDSDWRCRAGWSGSC